METSEQAEGRRQGDDVSPPVATTHPVDAEDWSADPGTEFMLHELENARSFLQEDTSVDERHMESLMLLISGVGAGLGLLAQADVDHAALLDIVLVACAVLPLITIPIFLDTVARDISAVDYIRAVNAVRQYFIEGKPSLKPYVLMPGRAPYPVYGSGSSNRRMLALITSAALALLPLIARVLVHHETHVDSIAAVVSLVVFLLLFAAHVIYWKLRYRAATEAAAEHGSTALAKAAKATSQRAKQGRKRKRHDEPAR